MKLNQKIIPYSFYGSCNIHISGINTAFCKNEALSLSEFHTLFVKLCEWLDIFLFSISKVSKIAGSIANFYANAFVSWVCDFFCRLNVFFKSLFRLASKHGSQLATNQFQTYRHIEYYLLRIHSKCFRQAGLNGQDCIDLKLSWFSLNTD